GSPANTFNGAYMICKLNDTQFTYSPSLPAPTLSPSGEMWIGRAPSHIVAIKLPFIDCGGGQYQIETYTPHYRTPANNVVINSVFVTPFTPPFISFLSQVFNGSFRIDEITSST